MHDVDVDDLEQVLRRTRIRRGQITLLKALYEAGGDYVSHAMLVDTIQGGDAESFKGVLAAFSNRINSTESLSERRPGYRAFIERRMVDGEPHLRLRPEAECAIERIPGLIEAFAQPMEALLEDEETDVEPRDLSLAERKARETGDTEEATDAWEPTTPENRLLAAYWQKVGGTLIAEVETGGSGPAEWPDGSGRRRLDGLRLHDESRDAIHSPTAFEQSQLRDAVRRRHVEVIEVKQSLNRPVIGQAIAGRDLFERDYAPATVEPVVVCGAGDPALEWVCRRHGIRVAIVEPLEEGEL